MSRRRVRGVLCSPWPVSQDGLFLVLLMTLAVAGCAGSTPAPAPTQPIQAPQPTSTRPPLQVTGPPTELRMTLQVSQLAWLRVQVDGVQMFEGRLEPGQDKNWVGKESIVVRSSNAGAVELSVNGSPFERLGPFGHVVEKEWRLKDGKVTVETKK